MRTFIDLFCGIGGFHVALAARGLECVFASDSDPHCREVYEANFGLAPAGDITQIDAADIPAHDILCGGFPCQPFSLANREAKGFDEARGTLFFDIARIVAHHRPAVCLLENVPRIITFDNGNVKRVIDKTFDELGYRVAWYRLNAAEFGAATARRRAYIVATRKDSGLLSRAPVPDGSRDCIANHLRHDLDTSHLERPIEDYVFRAHPNPPNNPQGTLLAGRTTDATRSHNPQGSRVYDPGGTMPTLIASGSTEAILAPKTPQQVGRHREKGSMQGYRVYDPEGPAPSQTADGGGELPGGGVVVPRKVGHLEDGNGGHSGIVGKRLFDVSGPAPTFMAWDASRTESYFIPQKIAHPHEQDPKTQGYRVYDSAGVAPTFTHRDSGPRRWTEATCVEGVVRRLHIEEAKTIQGFPADHILSRGNRAYKQIGNSVVPRMVGLVYDAIEGVK